MRTLGYSLIAVLLYGTVMTPVVAHAEPELDALEGPDAQRRCEAVSKLAQSGLSSSDATNRLLRLAAAGEEGSNLIMRNSSRWYAIVLIGKLKIKEAIPWLIENIELHDPAYSTAGQSQETLTFDYYLPCVQALLGFRESAIEEVSKAALDSDDEIRTTLLTSTLRRFHQPQMVRDTLARITARQTTRHDQSFIEEKINAIPELPLPSVRDRHS